ncbi:MAG: hypothetical protein AAGA30_09345, partial [Planctomycetota bacterium]
MGLLLIVISAVIALIGIVSNNKAGQNEKGYWFGLNLKGVSLLSLSVVGFMLGVSKELADNRSKAALARLQVAEFMEAKEQRDDALAKISEVQADFKASEKKYLNYINRLNASINDTQPRVGVPMNFLRQVEGKEIRWPSETPFERKN